MIEEFDAEEYNADMYLKILDVTTETSNSVHFLKRASHVAAWMKCTRNCSLKGIKDVSSAAIPPVNNE